MILKPQIFKDLKIIGFYLGKVAIGMTLFMAIPPLISFFLGEINPLFDFIIGILICLVAGLFLYNICYTKEEVKWIHGMLIVATAWLSVAMLGAIPLFLSGHFDSYLDAYFEAMSGITTTGLSLANDLAHMSYGHNLWRHLMMFMGGQGIVVVVLSLFMLGTFGSFRLYVGEGRDEKLLPNVRQTSRFIWGVSLVYLVLGTLVLASIAYLNGLPLGKALFHGVCIFMAAFDTGGFSPQAQNIMYYHSLAFEIMTIIIMIWGSINFHLHYVIWTGNHREIWRDVEIRVLFLTVMSSYIIVALGLHQTKVYPAFEPLFRLGFYHLMSAHTGTGFQTIYPQQFMLDWGPLSLLGIIFAMILGGCICSTTGGIKMLRLAMVGQAFAKDVKQFISSENSIFFKKIHHIKTIILSEKQMLSASLIILAYIMTVFIGALAGMLEGYPFVEAIFESASATGNVGLSCGVTSPSMPALLKLTYIFQMWAGRLEFFAVFALAGFLIALIRGR